MPKKKKKRNSILSTLIEFSSFLASKHSVENCGWVKSDYEPPGEYLDLTLTNDKKVVLRYPHMIAICENPDEFKKWLQKPGIDFGNEFFLFVQLSRWQTINMRNNRPIQTQGKINFCLKCSQDLIAYGIKERAQRETEALFNL